MKAVTKKILFSLDIVFALAGITVAILFLNGVSFPVPVLVIATIALISGLLDGSALIAYLVKKNKAEKAQAGYYEEDEEEDEE